MPARKSGRLPKIKGCQESANRGGGTERRQPANGTRPSYTEMERKGEGSGPAAIGKAHTSRKEETVESKTKKGGGEEERKAGSNQESLQFPGDGMRPRGNKPLERTGIEVW